ncbi:MAG: AmmeMemoRadiSam system protein B [Alphaproteobacteria bacterium]|nr:AmmeMemoRadiSam system protein B [Alphaproteobacteria bacterium]MBF0249119.1 AmmeMemoRadiSam system protein B [Alphaproteobacteria bacterium]
MSLARRPAVAGAFYPADPAVLAAQVRGFLDEAAAERGSRPPKAIIAPHAGYVYSGPVAAYAYKLLAPLKGTIQRVVLLGPCHRVAVRGVALTSADVYLTPLGEIAVDHGLDAALMALPGVSVVDATHIPEHSLEVHLPFLQEVLGDFVLIPMVVGDARAHEVADVLDAVWGGPETLIVISTDLSHYLDYDACQAIDRRTTAAIERLDGAAIEGGQACGRVPVKGLLEAAKRRGMTIKTLDVRNSGDTAGPKDRVVGYGAWALWENGDGGANPQEDDFSAKTRALLNAHGAKLLQLAKASIRHGLETGAPMPADPSALPADLSSVGACFVTLNKDGRLRGCIGSPEAYRPLGQDVTENAFRSAFRDPRFPPLDAGEAEALDIHISVLSPAHPFAFTDQADLLAKLRPGVDGLIIADGGRRALFLPSVWSQLPTPEQFLAHLKAKAGMRPDHWSDTFQAWRFIAAETGAKWDKIP